MSDVITGLGLYRERSNGKAKVDYIDRSTGWAFGYDSNGRATAWHCETGRAVYGFSIASEWIDPPAFSVGDLVLVDCVASPFHQHYGTVSAVTDQPTIAVMFAGEAFPRGLYSHELKPVTLPAPLPDGYRLKPRNVNADHGDIGISASHKEWVYRIGGSWMNRTCEALGAVHAINAPYFFAEPIPPEPTVDVGEGWRLLEDGEVIEDGDEYLSVATWRRREERDGDKQRPQMLPTRRRVPKPFSISDHGPGVYLTRDGREVPIQEPYQDRWLGFVHDVHPTWGDDGTFISTREHGLDLVRYLRPLPQPEWTPTDHYQQTTIVDGCEWTSRWYGKPPSAARIEQRWTNGTEEEWRPVVTDGV
jgi:hypothetical protein